MKQFIFTSLIVCACTMCIILAWAINEKEDKLMTKEIFNDVVTYVIVTTIAYTTINILVTFLYYNI